MRLAVLLGLLAALVPAAYAQRSRGGHGPARGGQAEAPGGVITSPGNIPLPPPLRHPFSITDPSFGPSLSGHVSGLRPYTGAPSPGGPSRRAPGSVYPVGIPVYVGGYGYPYYAEPAEPALPQVLVVYPPQPPATVVVNQPAAPEPARAVVREYKPEDWERPAVTIYQAPSGAPAQSSAEGGQPNSYVIVRKDSSILTATDYWVEGGKLHYVTERGKHASMPLGDVDREFTERLNRERKVEFSLTPRPAKD